MDEFRLIALDPGHFHAALVQKEMYPGVSRRATVYAPLDGDLIEHLNRVARFNQRRESPTCWELDIHAGPDSLRRMLRDRPGNLVVLSGRNGAKIERIRASLDAGLNVLADKPWIVRSADLRGCSKPRSPRPPRRGLLAFDIMTERYEIASLLQRELVNDPEVFGEVLPGTPEEPAVRMESVHHILKLVAGAPNPRPAWFFDIHEQGEALSDVGTHLVDLAQWTLFPGQAIDFRADIQLLAASRWPTHDHRRRVPPGDRRARRSARLLLQHRLIIRASRNPHQARCAVALGSARRLRRHPLRPLPGIEIERRSAAG